MTCPAVFSSMLSLPDCRLLNGADRRWYQANDSHLKKNKRTGSARLHRDWDNEDQKTRAASAYLAKSILEHKHTYSYVFTLRKKTPPENCFFLSVDDVQLHNTSHSNKVWRAIGELAVHPYRLNITSRKQRGIKAVTPLPVLNWARTMGPRLTLAPNFESATCAQLQLELLVE